MAFLAGGGRQRAVPVAGAQGCPAASASGRPGAGRLPSASPISGLSAPGGAGARLPPARPSGAAFCARPSGDTPRDPCSPTCCPSARVILPGPRSLRTHRHPLPASRRLGGEARQRRRHRGAGSGAAPAPDVCAGPRPRLARRRSGGGSPRTSLPGSRTLSRPQAAVAAVAPSASACVAGLPAITKPEYIRPAATSSPR